MLLFGKGVWHKSTHTTAQWPIQIRPNIAVIRRTTPWLVLRYTKFHHSIMGVTSHFFEKLKVRLGWTEGGTRVPVSTWWIRACLPLLTINTNTTLTNSPRLLIAHSYSLTNKGIIKYVSLLILTIMMNQLFTTVNSNNVTEKLFQTCINGYMKGY